MDGRNQCRVSLIRDTKPIAFFAPGAGLGHLVRAVALALAMRRRGFASTIITSSIFAKGMARLTGTSIIGIPLDKWQKEARRHVYRLRPRLLVIDTFPFGFRGEWLVERLPAECISVYLARRLRVDAYLSAIEANWNISAVPSRVIVIEPLAREHFSLLKKGEHQLRILHGRILLNWENIDVPVPLELLKLVDSAQLRLVVHSGSAKEIRQLIDRAKKDMAGKNKPLAIISPNPYLKEGYPCYDYFPSASLYSRALHVYAGAGYNSVAEGAVFPEKYTIIPFERRYDDQYARSVLLCPNKDATEQAALILSEWLGQ